MRRDSLRGSPEKKREGEPSPLILLTTSAQTCKTQSLASNQQFTTCHDLPQLSSYLHWTPQTHAMGSANRNVREILDFVSGQTQAGSSGNLLLRRRNTHGIATATQVNTRGGAMRSTSAEGWRPCINWMPCTWM